MIFQTIPYPAPNQAAEATARGSLHVVYRNGSEMRVQGSFSFQVAVAPLLTRAILGNNASGYHQHRLKVDGNLLPPGGVPAENNEIIVGQPVSFEIGLPLTEATITIRRLQSVNSSGRGMLLDFVGITDPNGLRSIQVVCPRDERQDQGRLFFGQFETVVLGRN